jgi:glycosyltransferase involved in cell wall biosynthesis
MIDPQQQHTGSEVRSVKGAVLYDFLQVVGGAEKVTVELANGYCADVIVGFDRVSRSGQLGLESGRKPVTLGADSSFLPLRALRLIHAFSRRTHFLDDYSWVVYSGNYAPLAVHNNRGAKNILYCHTLPRFIYDLKGFYGNRHRGWQALFFNGLVQILQPRYEAALDCMDHIVANSENVRRRIQRYLGKEAVVVHPPCAVDDREWISQDGYYLSLARLEPYKRVDKIIEAFIQMPDKKLVVASGGSDFQRLKSLVGNSKNIHFTGWLDEAKLKELIGRAIATLYVPMDEDFGMSPVESMAAGKPVIGVAEGGLLETVIHGETGMLVSANLSTDEVITAVEKITPAYACEMRSACEIRAHMFSREVFFKKMQNLIDH